MDNDDENDMMANSPAYEDGTECEFRNVGN